MSKSQFQTIFNKLDDNWLKLISDFFYDTAEDIEDYRRVENNKGKIDRKNDYIDSSILDSYKINASMHKQGLYEKVW